MSWTATDLSENEARQQGADLNVVSNQYGQRNTEDRREVKPPALVELATWTAAGELDYWVETRASGGAEYGAQRDITCGLGRLNYDARLAHDYCPHGASETATMTTWRTKTIPTGTGSCWSSG